VHLFLLITLLLGCVIFHATLRAFQNPRNSAKTLTSLFRQCD